MNKKQIQGIEELIRWMDQYDPNVQKQAFQRVFSGRQLYNSKTHRLKKGVRDEAQARAILLLAEQIGKVYERTLWLSADEKKVLDKAVGPISDEEKGLSK